MNIMVDTSLGIYFQFQTQLSIVYLKGLSMIGTQKGKYQNNNSFRTLMRSTKTWYNQKNGPTKTPSILKFLH